MATREAVLSIKVLTDSTQAAQGLDQSARSAGRFQGAMQKAVAPAIAAGAAVLAIGKKALSSASDLQQAEGAVEAVFGNQADAVKNYAETADTAMGLSAAQYNQYAALVGTALQNAGMSVKESVEGSNDVMQRGADLAALFGGTTAEAVEAINAAVSRSEFDPLEKYGVSLNMTAVNAELAARGQDKLTGAAADSAKKAVILEQIYGKSADAAGQFARESDSAAGSAQVATAQWENASAALGEALLPAASKVADMLSSVAGWLQKNATFAQILLAVVGGLAAMVLIVNAALKVYGAATKIAAAMQWLWNAAMAANPILIVVVAVVALIAVIVILWKKSETFRKVVIAVWNAVKAGARAAASFIRSVWQKVWAAISAYVKAWAAVAKAAFNAVRAVVSTVTGWIKSAWSNTISRIRSILSSFKDAASRVWNSIRDAIGNVVSKVGDLIGKIKGIQVPGAIKSALDGIKSAVDRVISAVKSLVSWIKDIPIPKIDWPSPPSWLPGVGKAAPVPPAASRGGLLAPRVGAVGAPLVPMAATGGMVVQINVTGALDPEGVARQINRVLTGHERRVRGRVT